MGKNEYRDFHQHTLTPKEELYLNTLLEQIKQEWDRIPKDEYDPIKQNLLNLYRNRGYYSEDLLDKIKGDRHIRFKHQFKINPEVLGEIPLTEFRMGGDTGRMKKFYVEEDSYSWEAQRWTDPLFSTSR